MVALTVTSVAFLASAAAWIVSVFLLGTDALTSVMDIASAQDRALRPREERRRITENAWSLIGGVLLAIAIGFGVDVAVRLFFDWNAWMAGIGLILVLLLVAVYGSLGILWLTVRREGESYAVLRADLAEHEDRQLTEDQVEEFRSRLERIDERHRRIRFGLRDRAGLRAIRARLDVISEELSVVPEPGLGAVRRVRLDTANAYLWRGNAWRLVPALLAIVFAASAAVLLVYGASYWYWVAIALAVAVASFLFALLASRLALGAKVAQHAVNRVQRADAVRLLDEREKTARRKTAGLGDRVARALQILRDQQS